MQEIFSRIRNFNVNVREVNGSIVFLRKLVPGGSNHSFGIHVAKLAGMPRTLVKRAEEVLKELESSRRSSTSASSKTAPSMDPVNLPTTTPNVEEGVQMSFFKLDDPALEDVRDRLLDIDIDNLTPLDALMKLHEIRKVVGG
jgi:DNA mismatch repair protein MutS